MVKTTGKDAEETRAWGLGISGEKESMSEKEMVFKCPFYI